MILMHMDYEVAKVTLYQGTVQRLDHILLPDRMPAGFLPLQPEKSLQRWQEGRSIPGNRDGLAEILGRLKMDTHAVLDKMHHASLTDCYWIKKEDEDISWKDVSFHGKTVSHEFADGILYGSNIPITDYFSPDYTTDGVLKKAWVQTDGMPRLAKCGGVLSANEVVASRVADLMGVAHVRYDLFRAGGIIGCMCPCFVSDDSAELVNGLQLKYEYRGNPEVFAGFREAFAGMHALDFLLSQTDRHEKNWGMLRNPETLETLGPAPVFDSGACLGEDFGRRQEFIPWDYPAEETVRGIIRETYEKSGIPEERYETAVRTLHGAYERMEEYELPHDL